MRTSNLLSHLYKKRNRNKIAIPACIPLSVVDAVDEDVTFSVTLTGFDKRALLISLFSSDNNKVTCINLLNSLGLQQLVTSAGSAVFQQGIRSMLPFILMEELEAALKNLEITPKKLLPMIFQITQVSEAQLTKLLNHIMPQARQNISCNKIT